MAALPSTKRALIDQTNSRTVIIVSVAVFLTIFSLVATKTLASQFAYQNRVISQKRTAESQLKQNVTNVKELKASYDGFTGSVTNVLKGTSSGIGPKDGDNAKIVLNALPSTYDFPSTVSSIEVLVTQAAQLTGITGTDNEVQEAGNTFSSDPQPVEIPFELVAKGNYQQIQDLVGVLERSIRPIKVTKIDITGEKGQLSATIAATTYYQPGKSLTNKTKVVQ